MSIMATISVAAHAVRPTCPYCDRLVRGSIEIRSAMADLESLLDRSAFLAADGDADQAVHHLEALQFVDEQSRRLASELAGEHLDCRESVTAGGIRPWPLFEQRNNHDRSTAHQR